MFIVALLLLLIVVLFFNLFEEEDNLVLYWSYGGVATLLTLMAGFRPLGVDLDSRTYLSYFFERTSSDITVEPSFQVISRFLRMFSDDVTVLFLTYAILSIPLFTYALRRLSTTPWLSLAVWMSNFFILQNLTQIRVAVSESFFILGAYFLLQGRRWIYLLCIALASVFHYSALAFFIGAFFSNQPLTRKERMLMALVPIITFVLTSGGSLSLLSLIPVPYLQERLRQYESMRQSGLIGGDNINFLNVPYLLKLTTFYFLLWKSEFIKNKVTYLPLIMRFYTCSIFFYISLSFLPILASRISELFGIVEVLLVPAIIYAIRPRYIGRIVVMIYVVAIFLFNIFYQHLLVW